VNSTWQSIREEAIAGLIRVALAQIEKGDIEEGKAVLERLYSDLSGETEGLE